jgi:hypothetical protein
VSTEVGAYELEILTGPVVVEEGGFIEEEGRRASLTLIDEQGDPLGSISFYGPEVALPPDLVSRANRPMLHLPTDMLSSVLALLDSKKRVFVDEGRVTTRDDSTV